MVLGQFATRLLVLVQGVEEAPQQAALLHDRLDRLLVGVWDLLGELRAQICEQRSERDFADNGPILRLSDLHQVLEHVSE